MKLIKPFAGVLVALTLSPIITPLATPPAIAAETNHSVTFTDGLDKILNRQNVANGQNAKEPTTPQRTGYTFARWDKSLKSIKSNTTINAKWKAKQVKVTFYKNDGTNATYSESYTYGAKNQSFGMKLGKKTGNFGTWKRAGYSLLGWSNDKNAKSAKWSIYSSVADGWINTYSPSVNLYAVWEIPVSGISTSPASYTMYTGDTYTIKTTVTPANATNKTITWSTSNSNLATVTNGKITAKSAGKVIITAKAGSKIAQTTINVQKRQPVTGVSISGENELLQNGTLQLKANIDPTSATNKKVTWTSSDNQIATVNQNGLVRGTRSGKAVITATTEDGKKVAKKNVTVFASNYTGFVNKVYYENGKTTGKINNIIYTTYNGVKAYYNVRNSVLTPGTASNSVYNDANGWYYIDKNGKKDTTFTGIAKNQNGTWYLKNGKVDFKTTGDIKVSNKTYYVRESKVIGEEADIATAWYKIRANYTGKGNFYADVKGDSPDNGTKITLYHNNGAINQKFKIQKFTDSKLGAYYRITPGTGTHKSAIDGGLNANTVYQWEWNTTSTNKKWKIVKNGTAISFINIATGKALDIENGGSSSAYKDGTTIGIYAINTTNAQKFILEKTADAGKAVTNLSGWYRIQPAGSSNYSLDINGAKYENQANAQIWKNNNTPAQKFLFEKVGNDKYVIRTGSSGGLSALDAWGTNNNVYQWVHGKDNSQNQRIWRVIKNTDGTFSFLNVATHKYLDLLNGTLSEGNNVRVWNGNDAIAEKWTITPTDAPETYTKNGWKGSRYFENGIPVTGWKQVSGSWYWFNQYGIKQTGWKLFTSEEGEKTKHYSYFGNDGKLRTGWFKVGNEYNGLRYANDAGWVYGAEGWKTNSWETIGRVKYRFNNSGVITGAEMAYKKYFSQTDNGYYNACGVTSGLMASYMLNYLHSYTSNNNGYKKFVSDTDGNNKINVDSLANKFAKWGVPTSVSYSKLSTEKVKDYIIKGQPIVPIINLKYWNYSGRYYGEVLHFVTVSGWKQEGNTLYFYTQDPYRNINTGWNDVNMQRTKLDTGYRSGYNVYSAYTQRGSAIIFGNPLSNIKNASW